MDIAYLACDKCSKLAELSVDGKEHIADACEQLMEAGAAQPDEIVGACEEMLGVFAGLLSNRRTACQAMMDVAHQCISELSGGATCEASKAGQRHSEAMMERLKKSHGHLVAAGAMCDGESSGRKALEGQLPESAFQSQTAAKASKIAPVGELSESSEVLSMLAEILPTLERLAKRVDDIARTPLPPLTIAKGTVAVSKQHDSGSTGGDQHEMSTGAIAAAFARLSKEDQTLTLIKASYANPIQVLGPAVGDR